jgi:HAE1 family hydrophobic/amphiphilic exporter-1
MQLPMAAVMVTFPGAAPQEVESLVTRPLESSLSTVSNITEVSSTSYEGQALILLTFNWGTNMEFAALEMREKMDLIRRMLPAETGTPTIIKFDPSLMPVMAVDIGSDSRTAVELRDLAERVLAVRLERIPGVASVSVSGGHQAVIQVRVDPSKLESMGVSLAQVTGVLRTSSMNLPGGTLNVEGEEYLIRSVGQLTSLTEIENLLVGMRSVSTGAQPPFTMQPVYLREVAVVQEVNALGHSVTRLNGMPSVSLSLQKQSDANTVLVANLVKSELDELASEFGDLTLIATQDQSRFIEQAISAVGKNAIYGGLLAVLVLFVFLKSITTTLVIAVAVPVSVVATFALIYFGNLTLNMMTLMGLALGIGMLVDNSIVVLENIFRHQEAGVDHVTAARKGTEEVAMAITASTLTTVAVFLPVAFVGGIAGMMFKELALTVSFSLLASLAVALIVVPMLSATILRVKPKKTAPKERGLTVYQRSLKWALSRKGLVFGLTLVLFVSSLFTFARIGGEFIPDMDQGELTLTAILPTDSDVADTEAVAAVLEADLLARPEVEAVSTSIGITGGTRGMIMGGRSVSGAANRASLTVVLRPGYNGSDLAAELTEFYADFADARVRASGSTGIAGGGGMAFSGSSVQVNLAGPSLEGLRTYANELKEVVGSIEGIVNLTDNMGIGSNELVIRVNRELAATMGVAPAQVASAVRTAFQGETVARVSKDGREIDVNVRLHDEARNSLSSLENLVVAVSQGQVVRLKQVAAIENATGPTAISRRANQRYVSITASIEGRDMRSVSQELQAALDSFTLPSDYTVEIGGDMREMFDAFSGLITALLLAIALVYMVMAAQFESLLYPFIIMFTMPLAVIGVLFGLFVTGQKFSVPSIMGIIILAGIVVNNAIVLVDYINQLRRRGKNVHDAIIDAAGSRLRPIIMTAATTILALLPLAILPGSGAEMQRPMAIGVIGGLTVSTMLTLYVIPLAYDMVTLGKSRKAETAPDRRE